MRPCLPAHRRDFSIPYTGVPSRPAFTRCERHTPRLAKPVVSVWLNPASIFSVPRLSAIVRCNFLVSQMRESCRNESHPMPAPMLRHPRRPLIGCHLPDLAVNRSRQIRPVSELFSVHALPPDSAIPTNSALLRLNGLHTGCSIRFLHVSQTLKRKWMMSPSQTVYSLPSSRSFPASRALASLPNRTKSS